MREKTKYLALAEQSIEDATEVLRQLISYQTVLDVFDPNSETPFGVANRDALHYLLNHAEEAGFKTFNADNYAGHIEFGPEEGDSIGVLAHLDVVPVTGQVWETNPFELKIKDGKLYGRGVADDKGPLVASYFALKIIKEQKWPITKRVRLIAGSDEESGSRCLQHYFLKEEKPILGFSPDADFPLIYGEKGMASFDIKVSLNNQEVIEEFICGDRYNMVPAEAKMRLKVNLQEEYEAFLLANQYLGEVKDGYYIAYGIPAHAMVPENGLNAGFILFEFLNQTCPTALSTYMSQFLTFDPDGKKFGIAMYDEEMKSLTMNVGIITIENGTCKIGINCRIPFDNQIDFIKNQVEHSFPDESFSVHILGSSNRHYVDPNSQLVQTLMNAYRSITGDSVSQPFTIGGGTYAKYIHQAVAFGPQFPNTEDVCHIANEYITMEDFIKSIAIYTKAIYDLIR